MTPLSPLEIQTAQVMGLVAVMVFIGIRFLPSRYHWPVGIGLTACYLAGIAAFAVYLLIG
jgi:uncharacterized membrane protein (UPF0136 family)